MQKITNSDDEYINGGKHSDNNISSQEFMIMPTSGKDFAENLQMGVETYHNLKRY